MKRPVSFLCLVLAGCMGQIVSPPATEDASSSPDADTPPPPPDAASSMEPADAAPPLRPDAAPPPDAGTPPPPAACKRGVAANIAPGATFSSKLAWWYNWGTQPFASSPVS